MSGLPGRSRRCRRNRNPSWWSARRTSNSGFVFRGPIRAIMALRFGSVPIVCTTWAPYQSYETSAPHSDGYPRHVSIERAWLDRDANPIPSKLRNDGEAQLRPRSRVPRLGSLGGPRPQLKSRNQPTASSPSDNQNPRVFGALARCGRPRCGHSIRGPITPPFELFWQQLQKLSNPHTLRIERQIKLLEHKC
jgi:hypothetical protein